MLAINERTIEAVAAMLYNNIYDLDHPSDGAWSTEGRRDDPAYLAFAKALLQAVHDHPEASDHDIIQFARDLTKQQRKVGHGWETIVIDQDYFSLPQKAEEVLPEIRDFIVDPHVIYHESNFLDLDQDLV